MSSESTLPLPGSSTSCDLNVGTQKRYMLERVSKADFHKGERVWEGYAEHVTFSSRKEAAAYVCRAKARGCGYKYRIFNVGKRDKRPRRVRIEITDKYRRSGRFVSDRLNQYAQKADVCLDAESHMSLRTSNTRCVYIYVNTYVWVCT